MANYILFVFNYTTKYFDLIILYQNLEKKRSKKYSLFISIVFNIKHKNLFYVTFGIAFSIQINN